MKQFRKYLALLLALLLALSLCACGGSGDNDPSDDTGNVNNIGNTEESTTEGSGDELPDGMVQYKVKVTDEGGNPVVGVMIQLCTDETCLVPVKTDETGVAAFAPTAEAEYHANFLTGVPEGYTADAEVFYFADGETELTIVLKAVA